MIRGSLSSAKLFIKKQRSMNCGWTLTHNYETTNPDIGFDAQPSYTQNYVSPHQLTQFSGDHTWLLITGYILVCLVRFL